MIEQAPFWPAVMRSILHPRNLLRLLFTSPPSTIRGAVASVSQHSPLSCSDYHPNDSHCLSLLPFHGLQWHMLRGAQKGLVKFVLITGKK